MNGCSKNRGNPGLGRFGTARAERIGTGVKTWSQRRTEMTNLQSIAGGVVWMAVALVLMLVALEPVQLAASSAI
jgi:poly(A) polymerase Pap1